MRVWVLGLAACVSLGCASPSREERGQVWCEHEGWWSTPHSLGPSELQGSIESAYSAVLSSYEAALLRDIDSHQRAIWQRLADLVRLARRQASEAAWRTLADSFLEGKRLRTGFQQAERIQEEFTQLLYSLDAGKTPESTAQRFFSDARFKELLQAVRRIWALAGRDSRALDAALDATLSAEGARGER